jgi:hypothetical protein
VLFSLLLFFQFGNEWSMAGWLPLFLIRRLGISPKDSLLLLALYWASLLVGRIISQFILKRVNRAWLLIGSILSALLGMIVLASTNNLFGAVMGILFVGAGFASIYPLVVEKIAHRFPYYHPRFLQRAVFASDDGRVPGAVAARLLRGGVGNSGRNDSAFARHVHGVPAGAADHAGGQAEQFVGDYAGGVLTPCPAKRSASLARAKVSRRVSTRQARVRAPRLTFRIDTADED